MGKGDEKKETKSIAAWKRKRKRKQNQNWNETKGNEIERTTKIRRQNFERKDLGYLELEPKTMEAQEGCIFFL